MYSVNVIINNNTTRVELLAETGDGLPKASLISGRLVVRRINWLTGADEPVEALSCFAWNATSGTYETAPCL